MLRNRRRFLAWVAGSTGTVIGGTSLWAATSQKRAARWMRRLLVEARRDVAPAPFKPNPQSWPDNAITMSWLGHATVLINFYGVKVLTDPVLGNSIGVSLGLGTLGLKRFVAPALRLSDLPHIDVLLFSHAHMDHMDVPTLRGFPPNTPTVSARVTRDVLSSGRRQQITELGWNESVRLKTAAGELMIEAFEVKHWGRRWPKEIDRGYNGYVLRREGKALLFGGDTANTPLLKSVRVRGPFEAAIMPIGAYQPWIWNHCTPEEAVGMANAAGAKYIVPVHHQTFRLSEEPMHEPLERLQEALANEPERLALKHPGETFTLDT